MNKLMVKTFLLIGLVGSIGLGSGCTQSVKHAQYAFDRSNKVQEDIDTAFFTKGWGMTRIAAAEANAKEVEIARSALLRAQLDKSFSPEKAEQIINDLSKRIANNEPPMSKSFAWLAFLLQQSERVNSMRGNVDFYLQSQHSIVEQLSDQVPGGWGDLKSSFEDWKPVLGDLKDAAVNVWNKSKGTTPNP